MRGSYVHLRPGLILAGEQQAALVARPLSEQLQVRLERFEQAHDALDFLRNKRPHLVIADYERFGAAGIYGLADLMAESDAPVILIVRDVSQWEKEQFKKLGVFHVFDGDFKLSELCDKVNLALKRRRRIGSSDRLPVVSI